MKSKSTDHIECSSLFYSVNSMLIANRQENAKKKKCVLRLSNIQFYILNKSTRIYCYTENIKRRCVIFIPDNFQFLCFVNYALKCFSIAFPIIFYQMQSRNTLSRSLFLSNQGVYDNFANIFWT